MISPHHHEKRKIGLHIFGLLIFVGLIGTLIVFDKSIRQVVEIPRRMVAGEHDIKLSEINKEAFKEEITTDSKAILDDVVYQAMNVTLTDLVVMAKRTEKVVRDLDSAKDGFENFVHSISLPKSLPLNK